jgi:glutathione S-transferase
MARSVLRSVVLWDFPRSICCQMVRLTLAEKAVSYDTQRVDIGDKREQFEPWYLALNPKGVVPTLKVDDEIVTNTDDIVAYIDENFDGPSLTPSDDAPRAAMQRWMRDIMAIHYGVLLYSRKLDSEGRSPIVEARGDVLRKLRDANPEAAALLDKRIEGNRKMLATLADPETVAAHVDGVQQLVRRLDAELTDGFVAGSSYSLADVYATAALARFDMHGHADWWQDGALPKLAAYYERVQQRPSWKAAGVIKVKA